MTKPLSALLALILGGCAAPEREWGVPQPLSDGGQITYLQIAIVEYPTELQVIKMCQPRGVPQMAIGPGCAKPSGDTDVIYVLHVPRDEERIAKYYDVLAQWGHEIWHLAGGRHSCPELQDARSGSGCVPAGPPKAIRVNSQRVSP